MPESSPLLYLSESNLEELPITTDEIISSIEHLIKGQISGQAWSTPKSVIQPGDGRYMMSTLSAAQDPPFLAVKSIVLNPANTDRGIPQINGLIMLLDSETGRPLSVLDGNWITAIRTAGASIVVARRLARPDSRIISFIGCGVQAQSHLKLFADMYPLSLVRMYGRGHANREALCRAAEKRGCRSIDCRHPKDAVKDADIVVSSVTLTDAIDPFINPHWLKPGAFLSSTDCAKPFMPEGMDAFKHIFIDDVDQEASMEDPMVAPELISGDISTLVNEKFDIKNHGENRYAFVFRSIALGDLALSALAYNKAQKMGKGKILADDHSI